MLFVSFVRYYVVVNEKGFVRKSSSVTVSFYFYVFKGFLVSLHACVEKESSIIGCRINS